MIRTRPPARRRSSTRCSVPAASGTEAGSPTPCTPPPRRAGRTSTPTAGSCSTSRPTAASATTWPPNSRRSSPNSRRCGSPRPTKYNGLPLADLNILETMSRWRPYLAGEPPDYTYYPDTAEVGSARRSNCAASRSRCWPRSPWTAPRRRRRACSSRAARTAVTCCSCRTGGCTTSTTSWARRSSRCRHPIRSRWGSTSFGVRYERTGTVEGSHTPLGDAALVRRRRRRWPTLAGMRTHPGIFGAGRRGRQRRAATPDRRCRRHYRAPFAVHRRHHRPGRSSTSPVTPYSDLERELAAAFAKD